MTELDRISELESVLQDLLTVAGSAEDTKVIPNCEIIDNSPAGLPSNYIIVKDENAHHIPAIKVPGLSYITGEFVNVLRIKGTEAVAYQYGSGSSTDYTALLVESIQFNLTPTTTIEEGTLQWDADNGTLAFGLPGGNSILQIGQEVQFRAKCDEVSGISNGDVVYVSGASGGNPLVKIATSASYSTAYLSFGMATEDISYNQFGYVTFFGLVRELDTSGFAEGDVVWLDTDGSLTTTIPDAPNAVTFVGVVLRSHATEGVMGVNPRTNPRIQDLSDVYASAPSDGDVLQWDGTNNYWLPAAVSSGSGGFPFDNVLVVDPTNADADYSTLAGAIAAASAGDTILLGVGTYVSNNLTVPDGVNIIGIDQDSTIISNSSATITLNVGSNCYISNLQIYNTYSTASNCQALRLYNESTIILNNVTVLCTGSTVSNTAIYLFGSTNNEFRNVRAIATGGSSVNDALNASDGSVVKLYEGWYNGRVYSHASAANVECFGACLNTTLTAATGTITGWYSSGTSDPTLQNVLLADGTRDSTGEQDFTAGIKADTIAESTAAAGVTIDGVLLKDGDVYPNDNRGILDRVSNFGNSIDYHFNNSTELNDFTWAGSPFSGSPTSSTVTESNWRVYSTTTANRYFAYQAVANPAVNFGITARIYKRSTISGFIAGLRVDDGTDANYYEAVLTDNTTYTGAGLSMVSVRDLNNPASLVTTPYPNTIISPEFVVLQINFSASISRFITYMGTMPLSSFLPGLNTSSTIDWTPARIGIFFTGSGSATYILGYDWITIV